MRRAVLASTPKYSDTLSRRSCTKNLTTGHPSAPHTMMVLIRHHMVVAPKAGEAPVKPIDVWANQTQKSASWLGLDSPFFGATTIIRWYGVRSAPSQQGLLHAPRSALKGAL